MAKSPLEGFQHFSLLPKNPKSRIDPHRTQTRTRKKTKASYQGNGCRPTNTRHKRPCAINHPSCKRTHLSSLGAWAHFIRFFFGAHLARQQRSGKPGDSNETISKAQRGSPHYWRMWRASRPSVRRYKRAVDAVV